MDRLNYFNINVNKQSHHEDNLTRAFMAVLRFSFNAANLFYNYCYSEYVRTKANDIELPELAELFDENTVFECQRGNPLIDSQFLLSVLITDKHIQSVPRVHREVRPNAVYDGIITYGNKLTLIIENKPSASDVREDQLCPASENLAEGTKVLENPVVLQWKEIVKKLNKLIQNPSVPKFEKTIIEDFFSLIDEAFGYLNPFDNYSQCKGNLDLLERRTLNILRGLVKVDKAEQVRKHQNWGPSIYLNEGVKEFSEINEIGLIAHTYEDKSWELELAILYGQTGGQAKSLYLHDLNLNFSQDTTWKVGAGMFLQGFHGKKVFFETENLDKYILYWKANSSKIRKTPKDNVAKFLEELSKEEIIIYDDAKRQDVNQKFLSKGFNFAIISPGINLKYIIKEKDAIAMDSKNEMQRFLKVKIYEAFNLIGGQKEKLNRIFR